MDTLPQIGACFSRIVQIRGRVIFCLFVCFLPVSSVAMPVFLVNILWMQRASNRQSKAYAALRILVQQKHLNLNLSASLSDNVKTFFVLVLLTHYKNCLNYFHCLRPNIYFRKSFKARGFFWHVCEFISNFGLKNGEASFQKHDKSVSL